MAKITNIEARKILDSRGKPTVEVKVTTDTGAVGIDSVPSGTSMGAHEAALVESDVAISNVNKIIAPALLGMTVSSQEDIDRKMIELDGTENKSRLGANGILGVSLAVARAAALDAKLPLYKYLNQTFNRMSGLDIKPQIPTPMMVMICGGKHAPEPGNICIQELLVLGDLEDGKLIWHHLEETFKKNNVQYALGLEGAFAPKLTRDEEAIENLSQAILEVGGKLKGDIKIGMDIAGTNCRMTPLQLIEMVQRYNIFSLEDPFGEEDWATFGQFKLELEEQKRPYLLIGDDLFATHKDLLQKGVTQIVANGIIIKPNQVGDLTELFDVMKIAYQAQYTCVVSHRSGETSDTFIADLAVGTGAKYLKSGAPIPSERLSKYQRLAEIAKEL